jgi:peptide deformylase
MPALEKLSLELYRKELANKPCRRVTAKDDVASLVEEMERVLRQHNGVGLAAPQVGVYLQLALVLLPPSNTLRILVNPEIANMAGKDLLETESCLSLPPVDLAKAKVWRSEIVHVRGGTLEDPDAEEMTIYKGEGARIVQHEIDHLHGVFFIDRCQSIAKNIVLRAYEKFLREKPVHEGATR